MRSDVPQVRSTGRLGVPAVCTRIAFDNESVEVLTGRHAGPLRIVGSSAAHARLRQKKMKG